MSDTNPEPTMEDILASIRRIISEDESAPAAGTLVETLGDLDVYSSRNAPAPEPRAESMRGEAAQPTPSAEFSHQTSQSSSDAGDDGLVSQSSAASAAAAFGSLSQTLMMPREGRSLEDVVRELLRPLLKEWLDANLPQIVQDKVQEQVERIARDRTR